MKKHAVMLYIIKDGKILFLVRNKKNDTVHRQGMLLSIGGKVEEGEDMVTAVKREAKEEANIDIIDPQLKGILYFRNFGVEKNDWIDFLFISQSYTGELKAGNEGHFVWEDIKTIESLNLYKQDKIYLSWAMKHSFFVADFRCEGTEMVDYSLLKTV